jgi:hypothetical protein
VGAHRRRRRRPNHADLPAAALNAEGRMMNEEISASGGFCILPSAFWISD